MRFEDSPSRRKRNPKTTTVILGLTLLALALGLCGLLAAVNVISKVTNPIAVDPSPPGISDPSNSPTAEDESSAALNPGKEPSPEKSGQIMNSYDFEYNCQPYSVSLPLFESIYDYFEAKDKLFYYQQSLPTDWQTQYYLKFLESDHDLEIIHDLVDSVSDGIKANGDELVIALTSLVQNLTYDCDKFFSYEYLDGEGFKTNFPYETLYLKEGVCGDSSILLGKILKELGYGSAFLVYDLNNHMAVGIQCPVSVATYINEGVGYCYIETTGPSRIGVKPTNLAGNVFNEEPQFIPINAGKSLDRMVSLWEEMERDVLMYGEFIQQLTSCEGIALYKDIRAREAGFDTKKSKIDEIKTRLDAADLIYQEEMGKYNSMGCQGSLPQEEYDRCVAEGEVVEQKVKIYNDLVQEYNQALDEYHADFGQYEIVFDTFNILMQKADQGCAVVVTDTISIQEETDTINQ